MTTAERETKLATMQENYARKRGTLVGEELVRFHHKHLRLFVGRFWQFVAHYKTPTSALLGHELFLVVEAASNVALGDLDDEPVLGAYIREFKALKSGSVDLREGAARCLAALGAA